MYYLTPDHYKIAEEKGIKPKLLYLRVHERGWTIEKAINTPPRAKKKDPEYSKWADIAEKNGISRNTFFQRVRAGWTYETAANKKPLPRDACMEIANESRRDKYDYEQARKNGIPKHIYRDRVTRLGWSHKKASETLVMTNDEALKRARAASSWNKYRTNRLFFLPKGR